MEIVQMGLVTCTVINSIFICNIDYLLLIIASMAQYFLNMREYYQGF